MLSLLTLPVLGSKLYKSSSLYEDESIRLRVSNAFPTLGIVACSGHLIDTPGRSRRFPQKRNKLYGPKSRRNLISWGLPVGIVQRLVVRILFFSRLCPNGVEKRIYFYPFSKEEFVHTSVARGGGDWVARFEKVLDDATSVHYVTNEGYYGDDGLFFFLQ